MDLKKYQENLENHLENEWANSIEIDPIKRLRSVEGTVGEYIENQFKGLKVDGLQHKKITDLSQQIVDTFSNCKMKLKD